MRTLQSILDSLGYDAFGNAQHLICESDWTAMNEGRVTRVDGYAKCSKCGEQYWLHPEVQGALWLRRGCDGLVKL